MKHRIQARQIRGAQAISRPKNPSPPPWPSYRGASRFVGVSPGGWVTVFVDHSLGPQALKNAQDLVSDADRIVIANDNIFGTRGGPVSAIVFALGGATDGSGGADHLGCDYSTGAAIEVCASFGDSARVSALFEAELSECSMNGNLCGMSTGEALSRWCAAVIGNNALKDFATAPQWAQDGMPDFVNHTDATDESADSTGCGMAFISWLISLGHGLERIAPAMVALGDVGTLAQLYGALASDEPANAWTKFQNAIRTLPDGVTDDDPFAQVAHAPQVVRSTPSVVERRGKVVARARTATAPVFSAPVARACQPGSRRLLPPDAEARWKRPQNG